MELRLIQHAELQGTAYAEFYPGGYYIGRCWSPESVYMEMEAFEATCFLVGYFNDIGPATLSGGRLQQCIDDLLGGAKRVSQSSHPDELWDNAAHYGFDELLQGSSWQSERRNFSLMLRDLATWMCAVQARNEPVTCLGL